MKNIINNYVPSIAILLLLFISSCTDDLDSIDGNPRNISDEQLQIDFQDLGAPFQPIFQNIYQYNPPWSFQLQQNLNADVFSGYMTNPRPFVAGANNTTYNLVSGWNNFIWNVPYANVMNNAKAIEDASKDKFPVFFAISEILKVTAMHRVSDVFGPIVYTKFGDSRTSSEYDSQEEAYNAFFADLEESIQILSDNIEDGRFEEFDLAYPQGYISNNGEAANTNWIKYANSLRLRLAIRISKASPAKAKTEGEKSLNHPIGLMETNADSFFINGSLDHPIKTINNSWGDIRMNASMESILVGYEDPRINNYFNVSEVTDGEHKGIRNGLPLLPGYDDELAQKEDYITFSLLSDDVLTPSVQLMTAAEVYFLKAEAALRGWSGAGTAQDNYELGINTSFQQYGASGSTSYITNTTRTPKDYIDPVTPSNNIAALTDITIAWDEGASNEEKLERIITQKWIAMFPEGQEAWSEYRRTGYPKIFPVVSNQSGGVIDTNLQIRRIPFVDSELQTNPDGVAGAVTKLGGPDNAGTRLWWDVPGGNF